MKIALRGGSSRARVPLFVTFLAFAITGCSEDGPGLVVPHPDATVPGADGPGLYRTHCTGCHGIDGASLAEGVDDLRDYSGTYAQFDSVMSAGPGLMPRFPQIDQQGRRALFDHVRSFKR